ncbi:MAG: hypothetical protein ACYCW6_00010 [Candidatus Xenobia bacterium]
MNAIHLNALTAGKVLKTARCRLERVVINTKGASANVLTLYDGVDATGTVIAVIDTTAAVGALLYGINTDVGLYAVLATGTPADLTIVTG